MKNYLDKCLIQFQKILPSKNITADIVPEIGAGGVTFKNVLTDFEYVLTNELLNKKLDFIP